MAHVHVDMNGDMQPSLRWAENINNKIRFLFVFLINLQQDKPKKLGSSGRRCRRSSSDSVSTKEDVELCEKAFQQ